MSNGTLVPEHFVGHLDHLGSEIPFMHSRYGMGAYWERLIDLESSIHLTHSRNAAIFTPHSGRAASAKVQWAVLGILHLTEAGIETVGKA